MLHFPLLLCILAALTMRIGAENGDRGLKVLKLPLTVDPDSVVQHHSIFPPFLSEYYSAGLGHWDFGGATAITDHYVRLVPSRQSKEGHLWNDVPNHLPTWTATIGFRIHGKAALGGDGFGLWYLEGPAKQGGPLFGAPSQFKGLGVIFDTFDNNGLKDNPAVVVIVNDGADTIRADDDMSGYRIGGCSFNFRNTDPNDIVEAVVAYDGEALKISLHSADRQLNCATVSPLVLPEGYYFGLTAHTGSLADNHDIHFFTVEASASARQAEENAEQPSPSPPPFFSHKDEAAEKEKHKPATE